MKIRVITSFATLPLLMLPLYFGGLYTVIFMAALSSVAIFEYNRAFNMNHKVTQIVTVFAVLAYYTMVYFTELQYLEIFLVAYFIALVVIYVVRFPLYHIKDIALLMVGFMYTTLMLSYVAVIRLTPRTGLWYVWIVFLIAFGSDVFAYFIGKNFGKHKLTPNLSPKKTIEGALGGLLGSAVFMMVYGLYMYMMGGTNDLSNMPKLALLGALGSIMAQIGDLVASGIKRNTGIKDFGKLLPGHGGVLDRFDSSILIAPVIYYLMITFLSIM